MTIESKVSAPLQVEKMNAIEVDVSRMLESDLLLLKKKDPFMYNSIPAIRQASLMLQDTPNLVSQDEASKEGKCPNVVSRRSRLTTECHPSLLLEDALLDETPTQVPTGESKPQGDLIDILFGVIGRSG